jgi:uncharacterized repeat protein (TIGR02543 family)
LIIKKSKKFILLLLGILIAVSFITGNNGEKITAYASNVPEASRSYIVSFNSQGGTMDGESLTVTEGSTYGTLPVPTKTNYVFKGWYTFPSAGTLITANKKVTIVGDHTLYAQWSGKNFDITLEFNGGGESKKVSVVYGTKFLKQLPIPVRSEYDFTGWYTKIKGGDKITASSIYKDKPPTKLYAQWKLKVLTITFVGFNDESYEMEVTCTKTFGTLPVPKREGYIFKGWYTWADYTDSEASPIKSTTLVSEKIPVLLFARWYVKPMDD